MRSQKSEGRDILSDKNSIQRYKYNSIGVQLTVKNRIVAVPYEKGSFTQC